VVWLSGRLRPRIAARRTVACDPEYGAQPWHGAVAALKTVVDGSEDDRLGATVVLSNHFVRYALLPWSDALGGADEEDAYARHHFQRIYGERAKSWVLRVSDAPADAPRLASAIDAGLIEALRACFPGKRGARLVSVQPYLMAAFNRWRGAIPALGAWLLLAEEGRTCVALHHQGRWRSVQNAKGSLASPDDWAALLDRERHRVEGDVPDLALVRTAHGAKTEWPQVGGWKFQSLGFPGLEGFLPVEDERYGAALAAA
jgi:hypothetical protein